MLKLNITTAVGHHSWQNARKNLMSAILIPSGKKKANEEACVLVKSALN